MSANHTVPPIAYGAIYEEETMGTRERDWCGAEYQGYVCDLLEGHDGDCEYVAPSDPLERVQEALTFFGRLIHMNGHEWHPGDLDEAKRSLKALTALAARLEGEGVVAWAVEVVPKSDIEEPFLRWDSLSWTELEAESKAEGYRRSESYESARTVALVRRRGGKLTESRLEADLGNEDAWRRYRRARAEMKAIQELCAEVVEELFPDRRGVLRANRRESWQYRLIQAANGSRISTEEPTDDPD